MANVELSCWMRPWPQTQRLRGGLVETEAFLLIAGQNPTVPLESCQGLNVLLSLMLPFQFFPFCASLEFWRGVEGARNRVVRL